MPLMAVAGLALLAALWVGLLRLGWELPQSRVPFPSAHGPLMVSGFLGMLIAISWDANYLKEAPPVQWPNGPYLKNLVRSHERWYRA